MLIEVSNLYKKIRGKIILSGINLQIEKGKIYGFVGPNGSGKTMLLRAIAGLIQVPSNSVRYYNPVSKGVIIEDPAFINTFSGFENLEYLASIRHIVSNEEIRNTMTKLHLDPDDKRKVKEYSLGMKQKLALAQAIMESPELLILDEPTRGLDEESVLTVRNLLLEERIGGKTILIASHNQEDIFTLCDKVFYIKNGQVTENAEKL